MWSRPYLLLRESYEQIPGSCISNLIHRQDGAFQKCLSPILTFIFHEAFQCLVHSRCFRNVCGIDKKLSSRPLAISELMESAKNYNKY